MELVIASNNQNKIKEIKAILGKYFSNITTLNDKNIHQEIPETGTTFLENALIKARTVNSLTGCAALGDDSGLVVHALDGTPGVYSARYSGTGDDFKNNEKLIENLKGIENRKAKFVSVITLAKPNGETFSFEGEILGEIVDNPRGNTGFGYDPHFYVEEYQKTLAELPELKNKISHRAKALEKLKRELKNILY